MELSNTKERESRKKIFLGIKPYFKEKLGRYTHQRISDEWHFYSLGFVRDEMTYVFGINIGFFKKEVIPNMEYSHVGMNLLVRTNGLNPELRLEYYNFFKKNLQDWILSTEQPYTSFRGGNGIEFPRLRNINSFRDDEQIIVFLKNSIDKINCIYPLIYENPESIFSHVVRAAPPWQDTILQIALENSLLS
jgi:hypothetical protein